MVQVGESATISCNIGSNNEKPLWIFNNPVRYHKMNISKNRNHLFLNDISFYDSGTYTCIADGYTDEMLTDNSFFDQAIVKVLGNTCG